MSTAINTPRELILSDFTTNREKALYYWNNISTNKKELGIKYFSDRNGFPVTGREIEGIWKKEIDLYIKQITVGDFIKQLHHPTSILSKINNSVLKIVNINQEDGSIVAEYKNGIKCHFRFGEYDIFIKQKDIPNVETVEKLDIFIEKCKEYLKKSVCEFNVSNETSISCEILLKMIKY